MDYITTVFKDSSKISQLIEKGYKVVVIGSTVRMHSLGLMEMDSDKIGPMGTGPSRLYFIFDNTTIERDGSNLGRVDSNLDEIDDEALVPWDHSKGMPPRYDPKMSCWNKIRLETTYPYECYIYHPGDGFVDGPCPEVHGSEYRNIVQNLAKGLTVTYISLSNTDGIVSESLLIPSIFDESESAHREPTVSRMVLYIQDESLSRPMDAILNV